MPSLDSIILQRSMTPVMGEQRFATPDFQRPHTVQGSCRPIATPVGFSPDASFRQYSRNSGSRKGSRPSSTMQMVMCKDTQWLDKVCAICFKRLFAQLDG